MHQDVKKMWDTATQTVSGKAFICGYAFEYSGDIKPHLVHNSQCHAGLRNQGNRKLITAYSSSLRKAESVPVKAALDFWKFILCPKISPWRKAFSGEKPEIIKNLKGDVVAFRLGNLKETPGQLLSSLSMVSRMPLEFPQCILLYWYLRRHKFSYIDAFVPTFYLELKDTKVRKRSGNTNHDILPRFISFDLRRLIDGDPNLNKGLYIEGDGGAYDGNAQLFSRYPDDKLPARYIRILKETPYSGHFLKLFRNLLAPEEARELDIKEALPLLQELRKKNYEDVKEESKQEA